MLVCDREETTIYLSYEPSRKIFLMSRAIKLGVKWCAVRTSKDSICNTKESPRFK